MKQQNSALKLNTLVCVVVVEAAVSTLLAQPQYVQVGTLPVPTASERGEVWDAGTRSLFSFPFYGTVDLTAVYVAQPGTNDNFTWTQTTSFPARATYWGRGATDGTNMYFCGTIDGVSLRNIFDANGLLGRACPKRGKPHRDRDNIDSLGP